MVSQKLIKNITLFSESQSSQYNSPLVIHLQIANAKGQELADRLNADKNIVFLGTSLMDCMIGQAIKERRTKDHIKMSADKASALLAKDLDLTSAERENILACVREHHGVKKFYSLESEIVCNADCYRFLSVKGVIGGIKNFRDMLLEDLVKLYKDKVAEKWAALSLDVCKKELAPQYQAVKKLLELF